MLGPLDVALSALASTSRFWRGTLARPAARQPDEMLILYEFEACPFCRLVREALTVLDLDVLVRPTPRGGRRFRPEVVERGGKSQYPYLVDPGAGIEMYESAAIVEYLYATYGGRPAPPALLRMVDLPTSMLCSALRFGAGRAARPSRAPAQPLELYSFESSPYSRRVRELLCELELPYVLRSAGKARWQDFSPPGWRARLFPELPIEGRNRIGLSAREGRVQVPYLIDPETGAALFESAAIRRYLRETYGA